MKNKPKRGKNIHLATAENLLKYPYESWLCDTLNDSSKDKEVGEKGKEKKKPTPLHWKLAWKKQENMGLSQAAAQLPSLPLRRAVLIILRSSESFQVIALKIPYLRWLKIISAFLLIDLPLYLYDLPFPNSSQVFENNNPSSFLPSLTWLVYTALLSWVHAGKEDGKEELYVCCSVWHSVWSVTGTSNTPHTLSMKTLGVIQVGAASFWATASLSWWSTVWGRSVLRETETDWGETADRAAKCSNLLCTWISRISFQVQLFLAVLFFLHTRPSTGHLSSAAGPVSSWTLFACCLSWSEVGIYFFIFYLTATGSSLELEEDEPHNTVPSHRASPLRGQVLSLNINLHKGEDCACGSQQV